MSFSLNEVEATAKRATRGAGYGWGLSEEAGKASRWLCAAGLDGAQILADLLDRGLAHAPGRHRPACQGNEWRGDEILCPLATGAALSDHMGSLRTGEITLTNVAAPALLLPFAANIARNLKTPVTITVDGVEVVTDGPSLAMNPALPSDATLVKVALGGILTAPAACASRAVPDPAAWAVLNRFAHRTYAPATEASRLLGAGSGLSDND
ncbi:DUF3726 domain-containing protein [Ruegeria lacuscaerulensis]|uniref:DUF3726 domain-containing protein n=1 Tax=Ruegeria lacuscaerulensis TaxID=55218 RepID=UPI00147BA8F0|nr:DUF3726 domain-containing protein [Ruegeria lacuscaerulensis]